LNETKGVGYQIPTPTQEPLYNAEIYPALVDKQEMDILLPTYGNLALTMECVYSIYNCTVTPFHLIILNADRDNDYGLTHKWALEFMKSHQNITYCHRPTNWKEGNQFFNLGLKYCRTEYVVTCMNSMQVEPYWEKVGLEIMKHDPLVGSIGFKCLFPNGLIESAGIVFNGVMPSDFGRDEPGWRHNESKVEMPACQWAFAMHRKKALVGNLPEGVFNGHVGWDDIDNCMCVKSKGWKIVYCGQGVGIHKPRATRGSNSVDAFLANQQNMYTFYKRWNMLEKYLEGIKMDVKDLLKPETKSILGNAVTEYQVLTNLLNVCNKGLSALSAEALKELGVSPEQYVLEMNPQTNAWNLKPRKVETKPAELPEAPKAEAPAGDTKSEVTSAV
jgi:GT2 family glycosyltransferase